MKSLKIFLPEIAILFFSIFGYYAYRHFNNISEMQKCVVICQQRVAALQEQLDHKAIVEPANHPSETAVSSQSWEKLQKGLQDTVIQVMVTGLEHNVLQPYKVPKTTSCRGSAFIISPEGEIITNAHVVNGATSIMVQMPSFGKHQFEVDMIGIMPEKDFALLKFRPDDIEIIKQSLGKMPFLELGDSDSIARSQEILALGYPLGQQSLKSTTGVISGRETGMIQMSAPINPGSSGGPSLNSCGKVIGINTSSMMGSQNVNYIIPINDLKNFLPDLKAGGLVRNPYIGVYQSLATKDLVKVLGNPMPGGTYVVKVLPDSPLYKKMQTGDMVYEINGVAVDLYGDVSVPWSEDKISVSDYISRLKVGQTVRIVVYRRGKRMEFECKVERFKYLPVKEVYPEYEELPFEAFGGYVVMPLMLNHLPLLAPMSPGLAKYADDSCQTEPLLVITHVIPNSPAYRSRMHLIGSILKNVNGIPVKTITELQEAIKKTGEIFTLETDQHLMVALEKKKMLEAEPKMSQELGYHITPGMKYLLDHQK